jgi:lipoprotein NlpI
MKTLEEIKELQAKGEDTAKMVDMLTEYIAEHEMSDEALTMRGLIHWSRGERNLAINDYLAALKINPKSNAGLALKMANEILDYYNKDLYNP